MQAETATPARLPRRGLIALHTRSCSVCLSTWHKDEAARHNPDCTDVRAGESRRINCPDGGTCHGQCENRNEGKCERVAGCGPLSDVFPGDEWPAHIRAEHAPEAPRSYTIEDVTLGDKILRGGEWLEVRGLSVHPESGVSLHLAGRGWVSFKDGTKVEIEEAP